MKIIQLGGHRFKSHPIQGYAIVDDKDFEIVSKYDWHLDSMGYANHRSKKESFRLHRFLMNPVDKEQVDHINGNKLDNRRLNLRICSHTENLQNCRLSKRNKSGYKGVYFLNGTKKWTAQITVNKKVIMRSLHTKEEAARVYNEMAEKYFGQFASLNVL